MTTRSGANAQRRRRRRPSRNGRRSSATEEAEREVGEELSRPADDEVTAAGDRRERFAASAGEISALALYRSDHPANGGTKSFATGDDPDPGHRGIPAAAEEA